METRWNLH